MIGDAFSGSQHVSRVGLKGASDSAIWEHAKEGGFVIVSKDNDFRQMEFLHGPPPKVVWLAVGNAGTTAIGELLRDNLTTLEAFHDSPEEGLLVLTRPMEGKG